MRVPNFPRPIKCRSCRAKIEWYYSGCPNRLAGNGKCLDTTLRVDREKVTHV